MARKPSSGFPFLTHRTDTGKYAYWRVLDPAIAVRVSGDLHRSWAVSGHRLTGKEIVKLSLRTGDHTTACNRWSELHSQVEALVRKATNLAKQEEDAPGRSGRR
jgi:hypothetical protein